LELGGVAGKHGLERVQGVQMDRSLRLVKEVKGSWRQDRNVSDVHLIACDINKCF
jgi:hypothetical protein